MASSSRHSQGCSFLKVRRTEQLLQLLLRELGAGLYALETINRDDDHMLRLSECATTGKRNREWHHNNNTVTRQAHLLQRLLQKTVARSLGRLNDAKAVRAALKITSDESETEMAARREPLFRPASGPSALPEAPASSANEASVPGPSRSLSSVLRTGDAIEVCLYRCSGVSLRKLLGVSRAWAQRARTAANSPKWIGAQASSEDSSVAEIEWALQSPVEADLGELI